MTCLKFLQVVGAFGAEHRVYDAEWDTRPDEKDVTTGTRLRVAEVQDKNNVIL